MTSLRRKAPAVLAALIALESPVQADEPARVHPSTGMVAGLRRASTAVAETTGEKLDAGHDWLYRHMQGWIEDMDIQFAEADRQLLLVPLSPVRLGLETGFFNGPNGVEFVARPDIDVSLRLPNIERRLRLFITSSNLQESPIDPTAERERVRAGLRFDRPSHFDAELGIRVKKWPSAFGAVKWSARYKNGTWRTYPFAKAYVETGLGIGASGGIAFEHWSNRWIVRSATYTNWVRDTGDTDWKQTFIFGYARAVIQEHRYDRFATGRDLACGVALRLTQTGDKLSRATSYESGLQFKKPLRGGWLYGYIEPVVTWERDSDWHPDVGVRIGFDALFWGLATRPAEVASYCR